MIDVLFLCYSTVVLGSLWGGGSIYNIGTKITIYANCVTDKNLDWCILFHVLSLMEPRLLSSIMLINEFRCYEAKIEEGEKAGSRQESNPGHLWLEPPVLCH